MPPLIWFANLIRPKVKDQLIICINDENRDIFEHKSHFIFAVPELVFKSQKQNETYFIY